MRSNAYTRFKLLKWSQQKLYVPSVGGVRCMDVDAVYSRFRNSGLFVEDD